MQLLSLLRLQLLNQSWRLHSPVAALRMRLLCQLRMWLRRLLRRIHLVSFKHGGNKPVPAMLLSEG